MSKSRCFDSDTSACDFVHYPIKPILVFLFNFKMLISTSNNNIKEAGRGAAARGVTAKPTGSGFDSHSRR